MDEHEKQAKEHRRKQRKEYVEKVKSIYDENSDITVKSRWKEVQNLLRDDESFKWLSKLEALTSWEEWVGDTEKKILEEKTGKKYRQDRRARDAFRDLLGERQKNGQLKSTTPWREVAQAVENDSRYLSLIGMSGSTP